VAITGLHWLLVKPDRLSITSLDPRCARTIDAIRRIVDLCAALGGRYLSAAGTATHATRHRSRDRADCRGARRRGSPRSRPA
jgi:hypothetical protein